MIHPGVPNCSVCGHDAGAQFFFFVAAALVVLLVGIEHTALAVGLCGDLRHRLGMWARRGCPVLLLRSRRVGGVAGRHRTHRVSGGPMPNEKSPRLRHAPRRGACRAKSMRWGHLRPCWGRAAAGDRSVVAEREIAAAETCPAPRRMQSEVDEVGAPPALLGDWTGFVGRTSCALTELLRYCGSVSWGSWSPRWSFLVAMTSSAELDRVRWAHQLCSYRIASVLRIGVVGLMVAAMVVWRRTPPSRLRR